MMVLRRVAVSLVLWTLISCKKDAPPVDAGAPTPPPVTLTFLVTGAENGYLLPTPEGTALRGGAAQVLGRWIHDEHHCVQSCDAATTLALSTGDNANGQSISSYFKGQSTAEAMKRMGYAASAFGNRELDWQRPQFLNNSQAGGFPYLAANLTGKDEAGQALGLKPFVVVPRAGVKVGIVGLAARKATLTPMPGRMAGLELISDEAALTKAVTDARAAGADVVVGVTDGCLGELADVLEPHPEWALAFVAGRDCERPHPAQVGNTALVYPGRHWNSYARVTVKVTAGKAESVASVLVEVAGEGPVDSALEALVGTWKQKLETDLGAPIGFSATGLEQESPQMSAWLTLALRETAKTDVAMVNRKGVRQGLPTGAFSAATMWDLVPFENEVVTLSLTGAQLLAATENVEARFSGIRSKGDGFVDAKGAPIDPQKTYSLATLDYLAAGGDGFKLNVDGVVPTSTHRSWQSVWIEWTQAKHSDPKHPLEGFLKP